MDWDVYIDETGDFSRPANRVLTCGVLLSTADALRLAPSVTEVFRGAYPGIPIPHHAADMAKVAGQLAAWKVAGGSLPSRQAALQALELAAKQVRSTDPVKAAKMDVFRQGLRRGKMPSSGAVHAMDDGLRALEDPKVQRAYQELQAEAHAYSGRVRTALRRAFGSLESGPWIVAAGEGRAGERWSGTTFPPQDERFQDRFLRLLGLLAERALMLLRRRDGSARTVNFHVSYRDLDLGGGDRAALSERHVAATLRRAASLVWPEGHAGPGLRLAELTDYRPGASPWFGVADFAASRVLRHLNLGRHWPGVVSQVQLATSLRPELPCLSLSRTCPAVAAAGQPREAIQRALTGQVAAAREVLSGEHVPWARAQASIWIGALEAAGRPT